VAVVLLDTYQPDGTKLLDELAPQVMRGLLDRQSRLAGDGGDSWGEAWLTAMARYLSFDWNPGPLDAPVLLVRASEPMADRPGVDAPDPGGRPDGSAPSDAADGPAGDGWQATWTSSNFTMDIPGDHFTMMETYADVTARAVHDWLA
ncbi:MAG TPA: hypothetical protein VGD43_20220, partial [Micromonospora sp.]